jgi:hypothetical protein
MGSRVQRHGGPHFATPDVVRAPRISKRRALHVRAGRTASLPEDATVRSVLAIRRPDRDSRHSALAVFRTIASTPLWSTAMPASTQYSGNRCGPHRQPGRRSSDRMSRWRLLGVCQPLSTLSITGIPLVAPELVPVSMPVFAGVVVIATGEFDEHARFIAHGPRIVTRWQQHHIFF